MSEVTACRQLLSENGVETNALSDSVVLFLCKQFESTTPSNPLPAPDAETSKSLADKVQKLEDALAERKHSAETLSQVSDALKTALQLLGKDED